MTVKVSTKPITFTGFTLPLIWQQQSDDGGCGFSAVAMLTDNTYARIVDICPEIKATVDLVGIDAPVLFHILAKLGYAVQLLREYDEATDEARKPWPPKPWTDRHLVLVWQTKEDWQKDMLRYGDGLPYNESHYVVMDKKGICYDPADAEHKKLRLSRYYKIAWVAGVYKVV